MSDLLRVVQLRVAFPGPGGAPIYPVDGVSFEIGRGETLALVGESGCGKTLTGLALAGLVPPPGRVTEGSRVMFDGQELGGAVEPDWRRLRGRRIGLVFQDPQSSLNPVFSVGEQIAEAARAHGADRRSARARAAHLLAEVGFDDPQGRLRQYPHQLSGGMRQRVMLAIALAADPDLLIADEPTTALDVTVQAQMLEILDRLRRERGLAVLLITHNLAIVAGRADRVAVMYAGQIVEHATVTELFQRPAHPYTAALLAAIPTLGAAPAGDLAAIPGAVPRPAAYPAACRFHPRCPRVMERCLVTAPEERASAPGHHARCWLLARETPA